MVLENEAVSRVVPEFTLYALDEILELRYTASVGDGATGGNEITITADFWLYQQRYKISFVMRGVRQAVLPEVGGGTAHIF